MGKEYSEITDKHRAFIKLQKIFFVATAAAGGRINLSPKGMDTLRVLGPNSLSWLNLTGSGNETAAHLQEHERMTLMFCAFEGDPKILHLYGHAHAIHPRDQGWTEALSLFSAIPGARQVIRMKVDLLKTSCGFGVPFFDFKGDRDQLRKWAENKGKDGLDNWWRERNSISLDGKPTGIF